MKIEIVSERENPLLRRKEITFRVTYKGATPKFKETRKELISQLKSDEKLTIVDSIKSEFGSTIVTGYAKVYGDEKALSVEPKNRLVKNFEGKKKKKPGTEEAKPAEEKPKVEEKAEKKKPIEEKPEEKPRKEEKPKEKAEKPVEAKGEKQAEEKPTKKSE